MSLIRNPVLIPNFNPRTQVECDMENIIFFKTEVQFQSTHSSRVRRKQRESNDDHDDISIHALK